MNTTWHHTLGLVTLAATLTACFSDADSSSAGPQDAPTPASASPADAESDGASDPITLRLGTGDARTAPAAAQIRWYARALRQIEKAPVEAWILSI